MVRATPGFAGGFSLVEMMIAILLGLLVSIALVSMFVGVRSASRMTSGIGALSDSGRFALDRIEESVRGAGNLACNSTAPVAIAGTPVSRQLSMLQPPAVTGLSPLVTDYGEPLAGYEAQLPGGGGDTAPGTAIVVTATPVADGALGDWATTLALNMNGMDELDPVVGGAPPPQGQVAPIGSPVAGSDILVVHETLPGTQPAYATVDTAGATSFPISANIFQAGQIGVISNCVQMEVFQVSTFNGVTVALAGGGAMPGNNPGIMPTDPDFTIGAQVAPVDSVVYYIGVGADGDGALFKYETNGGNYMDGLAVNAELVPDVENMQVLYGVEEAGASSTTQTVAQWVTADEVQTDSATGDFNGVIGVKIALLVASPPTAVPAGAAIAASSSPCLPAAAGTLPCLEGTSWTMAAPDSRVRKVYEQTMFLRDMSP